MRSSKRAPGISYELGLVNKYRVVAGVDEVGRGAWAGPLVAAAVVLHSKRQPTGLATYGVAPRRIYRVRDSKQLTAKQRQKIAVTIKRRCRAWGVGVVEAKELNKIGLARAIKLAQLRAVRKLRIRPDYVLVDGNARHRVDRIKTEHIIKADQKILSVAAASVIAKVHRDHLMRRLAKHCPGYGFEQHKGYGTKRHELALQKLGICPEHRTSYKTVSPFIH